MEILEGDALHRTLLERYTRNPRGWSFTLSPSPRNGFFDAYVASPSESWHLKLDTIFKPSPFVLGARTESDGPTAASSSSPPAPPPPFLSFGFRPVDELVAPGLLDDSQGGMRRLLAFLGSVSPVVPTNPGSYIQGPYVFTNRGRTAGNTTREQEKVDSRLSDEMLKLVRRRYQSYL